MPSVPFERFGGLDLTDDPAETGGQTAIDMLNVELDRRGRIRTRRGFSLIHPPGAAGNFAYLIPAGNDLLATNAAREIYSLIGGVTLVKAARSSDYVSSALHGTPTATYTYMSFGGSQALQKWDGTTVSDSNGRPWFVTTWRNRVVQARYDNATYGPTAANGTDSTVYFSDAGAPDTYTASNYVLLDPGNGEKVRGIATWRDQVYVFKDTAMYVFYATTEDATGGAIFNYRKVELGCRMSTSGHAVVTARDGVYFGAADGLYRTTGDVPVRVSEPIDSLFASATTSVTSVGSAAGFVMLLRSPGDYDWLVYDTFRGQWSAWGTDTPSVSRMDGAIPVERVSGLNVPLIYWPAQAIPRGAYAFDPDVSGDDGTATSWRWQSSWYDLGNGEEAITRDMHVWGTGTVTASVLTDYATTDSRAATVTLGTSSTAEGVLDQAHVGVRFSHKLSGTGTAEVTRVSQTVRSVRSQGLRSS